MINKNTLQASDQCLSDTSDAQGLATSIDSISVKKSSTLSSKMTSFQNAFSDRDKELVNNKKSLLFQELKDLGIDPHSDLNQKNCDGDYPLFAAINRRKIKAI